MTVINPTIVDYGYGNIYSLMSALKKIGYLGKLSKDPDEIEKSKLLILPGVGAFKEAIKALKELSLDEAINSAVTRGSVLIGICLGYQMLFEESEEFGLHKGLGLIPGRVVNLSSIVNTDVKIPNVGWRSLSDIDKKSCCSFASKDRMVYFVHSYIPIVKNLNNVIAYTNFGGYPVHAAACKEQVIGFQFHPEKSAKVGLKILEAALDKSL